MSIVDRLWPFLAVLVTLATYMAIGTLIYDLCFGIELKWVIIASGYLLGYFVIFTLWDIKESKEL